jgi:hypothetical protein
MVALCVVACVAGCKLGFDLRAAPDAAGADAAGAPDTPDAPDAPSAACTLGPWHEPPDGQPFDNVNTDDIEWAAEISDDGLRMIFTSNRGTMNQHLHMTQRASLHAPFETPVSLTINSDDTISEDSDPTFNDDELYFASGRGTARCIYVSRHIDTPAVWGPPRRLDELCAAGGSIGGLYITRDGQHLYYDVDGVLVMASRDPGGSFTSPGKTVGGLSAGMTYCALTRDEQTIYCEATTGIGDSQLRVATRTSPDTAFGDAQVVPGFDTVGVDFGDPSIAPTGDWLLYGTGPRRQKQNLRLVERECQ